MSAKSTVRSALGRIGVEEPARRVRRALQPEWLRQKIYDEDVMPALLSAVLGPDDNAVDAGAHTGHVLGWITQYAPNGKHVAIEPIADLATKLEQKFPSATVHAVALSDHEGEATFNVVPGDAGFSSLETLHDLPGGLQVVPVTVPVKTLDSLIPAGSPKVSLLKIDVEGTELAMLKGSAELLDRDKPTILFEHLTTTPGTDELHTLLTGRHGYRLYDMNGTVLTELAAFKAANADGKHQNFVAR